MPSLFFHNKVSCTIPAKDPFIFIRFGSWPARELFRTNPVGHSSHESSVLDGMLEQTDTPELEDEELASL